MKSPTTQGEQPRTAGWPRGILSGLVIVAVAGALLVWVPEVVLTRVASLDRHARVAVASTWFFVALGSMAWALRRLQARGTI